MSKTVDYIDIPVPWGHISGDDGRNKIKDEKSSKDNSDERENAIILQNIFNNRCEICNMKYLCKSSLVRHMKLKHKIFTGQNRNNHRKKDDDKIKIYECSKCKLKYNIKSKLLCHIRDKHDNICDIEWFKCEHCTKSFAIWKSVLRHHKTHHPNIELPIKKTNDDIELSGEKYRCNICDIEFTKESNLEQHLSKHDDNKIIGDNSQKNLIVKSLECILCKYKCMTSKLLFNHYSKEHNINIKKKILNFDSFNEFLTWKENEEKESLNQYITQHGPRKCKNGMNIKYYYCHRSGNYHKKGKNKRQLKRQGSKKFGKSCPSRMIVKIFNNNKITVEYILPHIGHDSDVCHLTISQNDRVEIAKKIANNIPFDDILNDLQKSNNIKITRKHLHNIVQTFKLGSVTNNQIKKSNNKNKIKKINNNNEVTLTSSTTKTQLYYELHDLVIFNDGNSTKNIPVTITSSNSNEIVAQKNKLQTSMLTTSSQQLLMLNKQKLLKTLISDPELEKLVEMEKPEQLQSLIITTPQEHEDLQKLLSTTSEINELQPTLLMDQELQTQEKDLHFETLMTFEQSKQKYINDLVMFINDNINTPEELSVACEFTKSFINTIKDKE